MATAASSAEFVDLIASEMFHATNCAVEAWLAEVEAALDSTSLSHMGRLRAAKAVVDRYKRLSGKQELRPRTYSRSGELQ
jgi:hypothetical protein